MSKKIKNDGYKLELTLGSAVTLSRWLGQQPLQGQKSRQRTQFLGLLDEAVSNVEVERLALLRGYAEKDEDGLAKTFEENGQEQFDITDENRAKFNADLQAFISKDYILSFSPDQSKLFESIRDILYTTDFKFTGQMANEYDTWLTAYEKASA